MLQSLSQTNPDLTEALDILEDLCKLTDADPRDLSQQQVTYLRRMFEEKSVGLFLFAWSIFGYRDLTVDLHLPICRFIGRWGESEMADGSVRTDPIVDDADVVQSFRRLMVCIPRECFKTSLVTRANALWVLCRDPNHDETIGIFNEKAENAQSWVAAIAQVVERSRLFQMLWREMIPKGIGFWDVDKGISRPRNHKWGGTGIVFERNSHGIPELSIEPHGIGGAVVGKHFTRKILDDIIGRNAAYSEAEMQNAVDWVDNSRPLERPAENGCELVVHTPWAYADVYAHMIKKWPEDYLVHKRHILENSLGEPDAEDGESIFPTKISTKKAKQLLKVDPFINWAQYMCVPKAGRMMSFSDEDFRYGRVIESGDPLFRIDPVHYDPELLDPDSFDATAPQVCRLSWMDKAIILDPAPSKPGDIKREPRSANGIVVVGVDPWGRRYCLDTATLKTGPTEVLQEIMRLCDKWGVRTVGIEEVAFSAIYAPLFQAIIRHEYDFEPDFVQCLTKGLDKDARIKDNLQRVFENHFWYFNRPTTKQLVKQMAEFPNSDTKDLPDALSYTDKVVSRPDTPEYAERMLHETRALDREAGLSGYGAFMRES